MHWCKLHYDHVLIMIYFLPIQITNGISPVLHNIQKSVVIYGSISFLHTTLENLHKCTKFYENKMCIDSNDPVLTKFVLLWGSMTTCIQKLQAWDWSKVRFWPFVNAFVNALWRQYCYISVMINYCKQKGNQTSNCLLLCTTTVACFELKHTHAFSPGLSLVLRLRSDTWA